MRTNRPKEAGFTLLEVLAAVTILSIASLSMTAFFIHAMSYAKGNENKTVSVNLARNALFFVEKQSFDAFKTYFITDHQVLISTDNCTVDATDVISCSGDTEKANLFNNIPNLWEVLTPEVNGRTYTVTVTYEPNLLTQNDKADLKAYLLPVRVKAWDQSKSATKRNYGEIEGYITNEKIR